MLAWVRRVLHGQWGPYLQCLAMLVATTLGLVVFLSMMGCYGGCYFLADIFEHCVGGGTSTSSRCTTTQLVTWGQHRVRIRTDQPWADPGERVTRWLRYDGDQDHVKLVYTPPAGVTAPTFDPPPQNPGGPPPYVWNNVAAGTSVNASYNMPATFPNEETYVPVDNVSAVGADGNALVSGTYVGGPIHPDDAPGLAPSASAPNAAPAVETEAAALRRAWRVRRWLDAPTGITLTTDICTGFANLVQDENAFVAMRVPVASAAITESFTVPLVTTGVYSNTLLVQGPWPLGTVYTLPLALRPQHLSFVENHLPAAPGEHWIAVGVSATAPISCPPNLNILSDNWGVMSELLLDLSAQPNNCQNCLLPAYYCLKSEPASLAALGLAASYGLAVQQADGYTCIGPRYTRLEESFRWSLEGSSLAMITPTQRSTLHHYVQSGQASTYTITYTSTLGLPWQLYGGSMGEPDLRQPLASPLRVNAGMTDLWFVSDIAPRTLVSGPHTLQITATLFTNPTDWRTTTDLIWAGGWVEPPPPPPTPTPTLLPTRTPTATPTGVPPTATPTPNRGVYLPLVRKSP